MEDTSYRKNMTDNFFVSESLRSIRKKLDQDAPSSLAASSIPTVEDIWQTETQFYKWATDWQNSNELKVSTMYQFLTDAHRICQYKDFERRYCGCENAVNGMFQKRKLLTTKYQSRQVRVYYCPDRKCWRIAWFVLGKVKEQNGRELLKNLTAVTTGTDGRFIMNFKDRTVELKPCNDDGFDVIEVIKRLFVLRHFGSISMLQFPEASVNVVDEFLHIILMLQNVEPLNQEGFQLRPHRLKWHILQNFLANADEDVIQNCMALENRGRHYISSR